MQVFSVLVIIGLLIKIYITGSLIDEVKEKFVDMEHKIEYLKKSNSILVNENNLLHNENIKYKSVLKEYNINISHTKISSQSGLYNEVFNDN